MSRKAYITGPTGAVGMALAEELLQAGFEVFAFVRKNSQKKKRMQEYFASYPQIHFFDLDLFEIKDYSVGKIKISDSVFSFDRDGVFFHLGWAGTTGAERNDQKLQEQNVEWTLDAVRFAKYLGCATFVGAGSQAEYGPKQENLRADTETSPVLEYGKAKLLAGHRSRQLCEEIGMKHVWVRILSVYGPFESDESLISYCVTSLLRGEKPKTTDGTQMWDFLYSRDAAKAMIVLAEKGRNGYVYPLGSGRKHPLKYYLNILKDSVDPKSEIGIGEIEKPAGGNALTYLCADLTDLERDTGYVPETSFAEGMGKTVRWFREYLKL